MQSTAEKYCANAKASQIAKLNEEKYVIYVITRMCSILYLIRFLSVMTSVRLFNGSRYDFSQFGHGPLLSVYYRHTRTVENEFATRFSGWTSCKSNCGAIRLIPLDTPENHRFYCTKPNATKTNKKHNGKTNEKPNWNNNCKKPATKS